ncbi:thiosulfate/3-mercaptopyruvate sulfurtransferase [Modicisalibacter ilicicola DSM 19980]|uniref:Thiosulfate/3-mercaptopyruvate sulfurtransferase n=1 Tax=Modicisalibacter ilicicola DSM 19980 TaxID=1121942 RepID=A0A1M5CGG3_9GAMM|nr:sulfurtransferase [Halomonas ilicicola]SHF53771.1 thiosulfate/3-mercaptopyruvate sulfurtransferase [Halomonas ilicicola DSM 19980]
MSWIAGPAWTTRTPDVVYGKPGTSPAVGISIWIATWLPGPEQGGRHPLPTEAAFTAVLQHLGISPTTPIVVYDDMGGQMAAARAWWMLHCWAGHPGVRLLDGGLLAWQHEGGEMTQATSDVSPSDWRPNFDDARLVAADTLLSTSDILVDARSLERFRGEAEPVDPVAGHIPGAICRPCGANLTPSGYFKSAEELDDELPREEHAISYCGSGVTACHNIVAYAIAGRPLPRLYAGSWSHWIRDPQRPVATAGG